MASDTSKRDVKDWELFQYQAVRDYHDRAPWALLVPVLITLGLPETWQNPARFLPPPLVTLAVGLGLRIFNWLSKKAGREPGKHYYITYNVTGLVLCHAYMSYGCALIDDEVRRYKSFISVRFYLSALAAFQCYMPAMCHVGFVSISSIIIAIAWHWRVGALTSTAIVWAFAWAAITFYTFKFVESRSWSHYQAVAQERAARSFSEACERALRAMLKSTFDASCECDERGIILTASPQLEQMINSPTGQLVGRDLKALAASPEESQRLNTFLEQSVTSSNRDSVCLASKIETALHSLTQPPGGSVSELPVSLCCVALPLEGSSGSRYRILIGCQHVRTSDDGTKLAPELELVAEEADEQELDHHMALPKFHTSQVAEDFTGLEGAADSIGDPDFETKSRTSLSYSVTCSLPSIKPTLRCDVGCQTETASAARPPRPKEICSRPSRINAARTSPGKLQPDKQHRQRYGAQSCRVSFKRETAWLPHLAATPDMTIRCIIADSFKQVNPSGRGCCHFHMCTATFSHVITNMSLLKNGCSNDEAPQKHNVWQCKACYALGCADDDTEDCDVCGSDREDARQDGFCDTGSSCQADQSQDQDQEEDEDKCCDRGA